MPNRKGNSRWRVREERSSTKARDGDEEAKHSIFPEQKSSQISIDIEKKRYAYSHYFQNDHEARETRKPECTSDGGARHGEALVAKSNGALRLHSCNESMPE